MKSLFIIIFFFINLFTALGQLNTNMLLPEKNNVNFSEYNKINGTIDKKDNIKKNLFCIDAGFLDISLNYSRKIKERWFIGIGTNPGIIFPSYSFMSIGYETDNFGYSFYPAGEVNHLECFVNFLSSKHSIYSIVEIGIRRALISILADEDYFENIWGIYFKKMIGWKNFKIGLLIAFAPIVKGFEPFKEMLIYFIPLARYNFTF